MPIKYDNAEVYPDSQRSSRLKLIENSIFKLKPVSTKKEDMQNGYKEINQRHKETC